MAFRITTTILYAAMLAVGLVLLVSVFYLIDGSLEIYPTQEQHDKARIVISIAITCLFVVEALLWGLLRYVKRREKNLTDRSRAS